MEKLQDLGKIVELMKQIKGLQLKRQTLQSMLDEAVAQQLSVKDEMMEYARKDVEEVLSVDDDYLQRDDLISHLRNDLGDVRNQMMSIDSELKKMQESL